MSQRRRLFEIGYFETDLVSNISDYGLKTNCKLYYIAGNTTLAI
jgi:hypothetical protein